MSVHLRLNSQLFVFLHNIQNQPLLLLWLLLIKIVATTNDLIISLLLSYNILVWRH